MQLTKEILKSQKQTANKIKSIIERYYTDLCDIVLSGKRLSDYSLNEIFNYTKNVPYLEDKRGIELVGRPKRLLSLPFLDCKKKTILLCSWAKCNNISYRLVGSSQNKNGNIHHIFPQFYLQDNWINIDGTYNTNKIGDTKEVTNYELF